MKFLIDNQLPVALSRFITSLGGDSLHVSEAGLAEASDAEVWRFACDQERIVVSKDEDFLYLAAKEASKAGVLWVRLGNCRTAPLLAEIERVWPRLQASLKAGERIIELR